MAGSIGGTDEEGATLGTTVFAGNITACPGGMMGALASGYGI